MAAAEIELFLDHAGWLCPQLPDPTRRGLVAWLSAHVGATARMRLQSQMPVLHPLHARAEAAVLELLSRDLTRPRRVRVIRPHPDRSVDWQATYLRSMGAPPHEFVAVPSALIVELDAIRALRGLATAWAQVLETFDDDRLTCRARRLRAACDLHPSATPIAFSTRHARSIANVDRHAAAAIELIMQVLDYWNRAFGEAGDRQSLLAIARLLEADDVPNVNTLLEVTARLSIARVATSVGVSSGRALWQPTPESWTRQNAIELRAASWRCQISKGLLSDGRGRRILDDLNDSLRAMGLGAVGGQPDIVIKFWHLGHPERTCFVLGDAKRNVSGTGKDYLREALGDVASYLVAYAGPLGLRNSPCRGTLNPMVTLFCARGVTSVAGCDGPALAQAEQIRRAPRLPAIMAFDLDQHFGPNDAHWQPPVLQAWFQRLSDEACAALSDLRQAAASARPRSAASAGY